MKISELSSASGVGAASIKFYVREGLLPAGERVGYNQTRYDDSHLQRLRLIRALIAAGGLTVEAARAVLNVIDNPDVPVHDVLGVAQIALDRHELQPTTSSRTAMMDIAEQHDWVINDDNHGIEMAAAILDEYRELGRPDLIEAAERYAAVAETIAEIDLDLVATTASRDQAAETVVIGSVLGDRLIAGMRRMAQAEVARRRWYADSEDRPST